MLQSLDLAAADALRTFSEALAQAQQTLHQDQARLAHTAEVLQTLTEENGNLRAGKVHNTQEQQRLDALRTEKAKLRRQIEHKRDNVQACLTHMQELKQPRLELVREVEGQRQDLKALRKQYCIRAAQIHAYVAQFLAPQNSLASLRRQLARVTNQRREGEEAVQQVKENLELLQNEVAALKADGREALSAKSQKAADGLDAPPIKKGGPSETAQQYDNTERECKEDNMDDNDDGVVAVLTDAEEFQRLAAQRAEQQAAFATARLQYEEEEAQLQRRRGALKQLVLELCGKIEAADTAQQEEQKSYHDALNGAVSSGANKRCQCCNGDLLLEFS